MGYRVDQRLIRSVPDEGIGYDDCRRVRGGTPERREVDDRRRKLLGEKDVARQIAMHELAPDS